jgi:cell division protein FtsQ
MARKSPTISQEELYLQPDEPVREELDDARLLDLDAEEESPFLRGQKRVSVRRGTLPRKTAARLTWAVLAAGIVFLSGIGVASLYHYGERSWRFRLESSDDIEIDGTQNVTRAQVMEVMGGDIGRNIFFVPLDQRKKQLEQVPWVESASVMRFAPNRLRIEIHERTPVAFARVGSKILLTDSAGTLMELPGKKKYSFPVIIGMNPGEPASTRSARMKIYNDVISQLDSGGAHYSQDLSEVDLTDPDDVKVLANNRDGEVLVHLGSANYLERYKIYVAHVQEWRQQFSKLESVDLRYDRQIIVNPDLEGTAKQVPLSPWAAKKAMAAGVKPAALISHIALAPHAPAATLAAAPAKTPVRAAKSKASKTRRKHAVKKTRTRAVRSTMQKTALATGAKTTVAPVQATTSGKKPSPAIPKDQGHQ